ncbi:TIGR03749 family integrating conjugative element protein [Pseudomonas silvicola]|nr:TIGR03749 family integrating conjugative element protein [Pseudomonas silvicola]
MNRHILILAFACSATWCATTSAVEVKHWDRLPLAVPLVVGQERILMLDENVRVGVPNAISAKLRVQSVGSTVYLLASDAIPPTRLQLQSVKSGDMVLIDIEAVAGTAALEPIKIVADAKAPEAEAASSTTPAVPATPIPVVLTRYAAQNLYAPLRTVAPLPGLRRVPVGKSVALSALLPTERVTAKALAAWRLGDYWVTAVKLVNQGTSEVLLDPRHIQATLFAATFQHNSLGSAGTPEDTTVAYLVTRGGGLKQALLLPPPKPEGADHES